MELIMGILLRLQECRMAKKKSSICLKNRIAVRRYKSWGLKLKKKRAEPVVGIHEGNMDVIRDSTMDKFSVLQFSPVNRSNLIIRTLTTFYRL